MEDVRNTIKVGNNFVVFCLLARRLVAVCSWETTFHCSRKINATSAYHQVELWSLVNSTTFVFVHKLHGCCYYHGTNKTLHFGSINQLRRKFEPLISKLHLYWRWNIGSMYVAHICSVQCTEQIAHKPHSYWDIYHLHYSFPRFLRPPDIGLICFSALFQSHPVCPKTFAKYLGYSMVLTASHFVPKCDGVDVIVL